jgi:hypothetical protein
MFKSILGLVDDVATIVTAPVEVAIDVTRVLTKPVADVAKATKDEIKTITGD